MVSALKAAVDQVARTDDRAERDKRDSELESRLKSEELRIVTVSRARFNPRYRGRVLLNAKAVRTALHHITWCLAHAVPYDAGVYPSTTVEEAPRPRLLSAGRRVSAGCNRAGLDGSQGDPRAQAVDRSVQW